MGFFSKKVKNSDELTIKDVRLDGIKTQEEAKTFMALPGVKEAMLYLANDNGLAILTVGPVYTALDNLENGKKPSFIQRSMMRGFGKNLATTIDKMAKYSKELPHEAAKIAKEGNEKGDKSKSFEVIGKLGRSDELKAGIEKAQSLADTSLEYYKSTIAKSI